MFQLASFLGVFDCFAWAIALSLLAHHSEKILAISKLGEIHTAHAHRLSCVFRSGSVSDTDANFTNTNRLRRLLESNWCDAETAETSKPLWNSRSLTHTRALPLSRMRRRGCAREIAGVDLLWHCTLERDGDCFCVGVSEQEYTVGNSWFCLLKTER